MKFHSICSKKPGPVWIYHLAAPFLCFYALEYYTHDPWTMDLVPQLVNYVLFLALYLTVYYLAGAGYGAAIAAPLVVCLYSGLAGIPNHYVLAFRGNPILPWDFYSLRTALSVSNNYSFTPDKRIWISSIVLLLVADTGILLAHRIYPRGRGKEKAVSLVRARLLPAGLCLLVFVSTSLAMMNSAITGFLLTPTNLFTQWASYRDNGFTVTFTQNLQYLHIKKPAGYKKDMVETELADYLDQNRESYKESKREGLPEDPTVFVVMDEAFSDPAVLHDFSTSQDYMPGLHALQKLDQGNVLTGNLFVSVCGGNTANTEFEFLTGNTMAYLPVGSVAYQQYIHKNLDSLASLYRRQDYHTIGLHPFNSSGWNRKKVYPWLGFQETGFKEAFVGAGILRKYVDDASAFDKLKETYSQTIENNQAPIFAFEVTMQNHGGYTEVFDNCPIDVTMEDSKHPYTKYTNHYLTLVRKTDEALQDFITWMDQQQEPMILVFFGDHQPNDYVVEPIARLTGSKPEDRGFAEQQNRYIVPYLVYANYDFKTDIQEADPEALDPELIPATTTSVNYLGAYLADITGQDLTPYQEFLLLLHKKLPVITANLVIDQDGSYLTVDQAKNIYQEELNLYEKLQYYYLFDN